MQSPAHSPPPCGAGEGGVEGEHINRFHDGVNGASLRSLHFMNGFCPWGEKVVLCVVRGVHGHNWGGIPGVYYISPGLLILILFWEREITSTLFKSQTCWAFTIAAWL